MLATIDKDARDIGALQEKNKRLESEMHELRTAFSTMSLRMMEELRDVKSSLRDHDDKLLSTDNTPRVYLRGPLTIKKKIYDSGRESLSDKILAKVTFPLKTEEEEPVFLCDQEFFIVNDEDHEVLIKVAIVNDYGLRFDVDDPAFEDCSGYDGFIVPANTTLLLPKATICFPVEDMLNHGLRFYGNNSIIKTSSCGTRFQYTIHCKTEFRVLHFIKDDDGRLKRFKIAKPIRLNWRIEVVKPEEIPLPDETPWEKDPLNLVGKHIFYKSGISSEPLSGFVVAYDKSRQLLCINGTEFIDMKFWFISLENAVWFAPMK